MSDKLSISHQFIDDAFDPLRNDNIELLVHLGQGSISYAYFDGSLQRIVTLESFSSEPDKQQKALDQIFKDKEWKGKKFKAVKVIFENDYFSLIPTPLFEEKSLKEYINLNQEMLAELEFSYFSDPVTSLKIYNAYAIPVADKMMVEDYFPSPNIRHHISVLADSLARHLQQQPGEAGLFVNFRTNAIDILYFKDLKLQFCKSFRNKTREDILYHILHVADHLKLDTKQIPVILLGQIDSTMAEYRLLEQYLAQLGVMAGSVDDQLSKRPADIPKHRFFSLLSLSQCES